MCFKIERKNIYSLALVDTKYLVHSAIVSWDFWAFIGGKISRSLDQQVGTADGQGEGLLVMAELSGGNECTNITFWNL